ncbi:MAG: histidine phosphatase family protein [Candidatus Thermoplasmatota archaeon]|nr:histidine phosphatase family protein [Candidatus Thermoplasmatota archaeon]MEE3269793.1 histidine phosphatase family protein [Candidatus Thermoplasmatota archaeon]
MPNRLVVMRHAESSLDYPGLADHDRPLNARGQHDASRIAQVLSDRGWLPQLILVSSSRRTIETLERISPLIDKARIEIRPEIYHAGLSSMSEQLEDALEEGTTMILGHNPGSEVLVNHLTGEWKMLPTAAAALIEKSGEKWELIGVLRPKELG